MRTMTADEYTNPRAVHDAIEFLKGQLQAARAAATIGDRARAAAVLAYTDAELPGGLVPRARRVYRQRDDLPGTRIAEALAIPVGIATALARLIEAEQKADRNAAVAEQIARSEVLHYAPSRRRPTAAACTGLSFSGPCTDDADAVTCAACQDSRRFPSR